MPSELRFKTPPSFPPRKSIDHTGNLFFVRRCSTIPISISQFPPPSPSQSRGDPFPIKRSDHALKTIFHEFVPIPPFPAYANMETGDKRLHETHRNSFLSHQICVCARDLKKSQFSGTLNPATPPPPPPCTCSLTNEFPNPVIFVKDQISPSYSRSPSFPRRTNKSEVPIPNASADKSDKPLYYKIMDFIVFPIIYSLIRGHPSGTSESQNAKKKRKNAHICSIQFSR